MNKHEMTAAEYRKAIVEFRPTVGLKAEIYTSLDALHSGKLFSVALYANGITNSHSGYFRVDADTLGELFEALTNKWAEYREQHREETVRKMALAIIRITAELGACTDAALRNCGEFDLAQIQMYGEDACSDANDIAGRGPFSIVSLRGANGGEEDEDAA